MAGDDVFGLDEAGFPQACQFGFMCWKNA